MAAAEDAAYSPSARTTPTRNAQRVGYERREVHEVLDDGFLCHVGFVVDGAPVVLPHVCARVGETLYLHGSTGARAFRAPADGLAVCVTVTLVDGLVLARSAFHHSINYRSVVAHGVATPVRDEQEKQVALDAIVEAVARGRSAHTRAPSARELAATAVLALPLDEVSVKVRSGPPNDDADDLGLDHWAGILPLRTVPGTPIPADGVLGTLPDHVVGWTARAATC